MQRLKYSARNSILASTSRTNPKLVSLKEDQITNFSSTTLCGLIIENKIINSNFKDKSLTQKIATWHHKWPGNKTFKK